MATKKAKPKKAAPKKPKAKPVKKVAPKAARPKTPRSQVLPGMEQVRHRVLDNICEGIAEERGAMAAARTEEKSFIQQALREMEARKVQVYRHAGVELALIPGDVHLRVRLVKEKANRDGGVAETGPDAPADEAVTEDEMTEGDADSVDTDTEDHDA